MKIIPLLVAAAMSAVVPQAAHASDRDDVLAVVDRFRVLGNELDIRSAAALCADQAVITDMFAPFVWNGHDACIVWAEDGDRYAKAHGITDGVVEFGEAPQVVVEGDRAYAAMPTSFRYSINGKPAAAPLRSVWTYALRRVPQGWRITSVTWGAR